MRAALCLAALLSALAAPLAAQDWDPAGAGVLDARFVDPTDRYGHNVLGDTPEWGGLELTVDTCAACAGVHRAIVTFTLPTSQVFEDIAPRLADVDGDGRREAVVVVADLRQGAALAVYGPAGLIARTGWIGMANRWLAPAGVADFDGDGRAEIAYVDRPHLLRELVFVRQDGDRLVEVARLPGVTNHRIGEDFISGGVRKCGQRPEVVAASPDWARLLLIGWEAGGPVARDAGAWSAAAADRALSCKEG